MGTYEVNPMNILMAIKNGQNPQQLLLSIMENQMGQTPIGQNLIMMAKANNAKGIENVVRNLAQQRGIDYDSAFSAFKSSVGLK